MVTVGGMGVVTSEPDPGSARGKSGSGCYGRQLTVSASTC